MRSQRLVSNWCSDHRFGAQVTEITGRVSLSSNQLAHHSASVIDLARAAPVLSSRILVRKHLTSNPSIASATRTPTVISRALYRKSNSLR